MLIRPGMFVKILRNKERFWVKVSSVNGKKITGIVDNKLVVNKKINYGSKISFSSDKVLEIRK